MKKIKSFLKLKAKELRASLKRLFCTHGLTSGIVNHRDILFIGIETIIDMSVCEYCGKISFFIRRFEMGKNDSAIESISLV